MAQLFGNDAPDFSFSPFAGSSANNYVLAYKHSSRKVELTNSALLPTGDVLSGNTVAFSEDNGSGNFDSGSLDLVFQTTSKGTILTVNLSQGINTSVDLDGGKNIASGVVPAILSSGLPSDTIAGVAELEMGATIHTLIVEVQSSGFLRLRPTSALPSGSATLRPFSVAFYVPSP